MKMIGEYKKRRLTKMKQAKKFISLVMTGLMLISCMPMTAITTLAANDTSVQAIASKKQFFTKSAEDSQRIPLHRQTL